MLDKTRYQPLSVQDAALAQEHSLPTIPRIRTVTYLCTHSDSPPLRM